MNPLKRSCPDSSSALAPQEKKILLEEAKSQQLFKSPQPFKCIPRILFESSILNRLTNSELVNFSLVCKEWSIVTSSEVYKKRKHLQHKKKLTISAYHDVCATADTIYNLKALHAGLRTNDEDTIKKCHKNRQLILLKKNTFKQDLENLFFSINHFLPNAEKQINEFFISNLQNTLKENDTFFISLIKNYSKHRSQIIEFLKKPSSIVLKELHCFLSRMNIPCYKYVELDSAWGNPFSNSILAAWMYHDLCQQALLVDNNNFNLPATLLAISEAYYMNDIADWLEIDEGLSLLVAFFVKPHPLTKKLADHIFSIVKERLNEYTREATSKNCDPLEANRLYGCAMKAGLMIAKLPLAWEDKKNLIKSYLNSEDPYHRGIIGTILIPQELNLLFCTTFKK